MPLIDVLERLETTERGLSSAEARERLRRSGPNALVEPPPPTPWGLVLEQLRDVTILVLIAAAAAAALIGERLDAAAILAVVLLNAAVGATQQYRAERALAGLRALAAPTSTAMRDGRATAVPARDLVVGDVVRLDAGALVPADLRLMSAPGLRVDESPLTGESAPVDKATAEIDDDTVALGDRLNLAFSGTLVTSGRAEGVTVATGMATELGRIARLLGETAAVATPLQKRLARLARSLAAAALAVCGIVFVLGLLQGTHPLLMFLTAVSLAVAAVPEALPAVVTVSLALAARRMAARRALVRRLSAVETLGSVTYICADKTGTLTVNRMRVEQTWGDRDELLEAMALCNDAELGSQGEARGDPTEVALARAAHEVGVGKPALEQRLPRVAELSFEAARRRMTTLHQDRADGHVSFTKGAPEAVLPLVRARDAESRLRLEQAAIEADRMASEGLRVLAFAGRRWTARPATGELESGLRLLGLVGMLDPPRPAAREAIATCRAAGIVPVMITGDHALTARAVAERLGLIQPGDEVLTGLELEALSEAELAERAARVRVYARVAPEQKLRIVEALQARGEVVAMTGDGVNDAPALQRADIGVAMGLAGTDAARGASAIVLLDDDFATIVQAVREGRRVYDNLRRFVRYAISTNSAEVLTLLVAPLLGLPVPLLPIQLLWVNLVTDSLPGLALSAERAEKDVMRRPPRPPREGVFAHGMGLQVAWLGLLMAVVAVATQGFYQSRGAAVWQTMVFTVLSLSQLASVMAMRSERRSLFEDGTGSNRPLLAAVAASAALQLATIYIPALRPVFHTEPLGAADLAVAFVLSSLPFVALEIEKKLRRRA
jgi:Ca2+-transporting ATPase